MYAILDHPNPIVGRWTIQNVLASHLADSCSAVILVLPECRDRWIYVMDGHDSIKLFDDDDDKLVREYGRVPHQYQQTVWAEIPAR